MTAATEMEAAATTEIQAPRLEITYIPVSAIAEHPKNPRKSLKGVDDLAASMKTNGLLQPVVVVPMDAFLAAQPDDGVRIQAMPGLEYVTVIGHRRMAAAESLEWDTVPAIIRPDMDSALQTAKTFIVENLQRVDLDPIEEATGLAELAAMGLSQRQIATECGVSQPHVSKRLALLRMPQAAQDALVAEKMTLVEAQKLTALSPEHQLDAWDLVENHHWGVELAARNIENRIEADKAKDKARRQAQQEGVELVDPHKAFGRNYWNHQIYNDREIAKARKAGTLRAEATGHGLAYYSTIPRESSKAVHDEEDRAKKRASKNRAPALAQLVTKPPTTQQIARELAAAVVHGEVGHFDALKLAKSLLPARIGRREDGSVPGDVYTWRDAIEEKDWPWVAWVMTVAATEQSARASYTVWGPRQAAHLQRLIDQTGYEPTDWEREQLDRIRRDADEETGAAGSDTAGITDQAGPADHADATGRGCDPDCGCEAEDQFVDPKDPEQDWIDAAGDDLGES